MSWVQKAIHLEFRADLWCHSKHIWLGSAASFCVDAANESVWHALLPSQPMVVVCKLRVNCSRSSPISWPSLLLVLLGYGHKELSYIDLPSRRSLLI